MYILNYIIIYKGFNLLLFGFGSKKGLVESFLKNNLVDEKVVLVNGFEGDASVKHITKCILRNALNCYRKYSFSLTHIHTLSRSLLNERIISCSLSFFSPPLSLSLSHTHTHTHKFSPSHFHSLLLSSLSLSLRYLLFSIRRVQIYIQVFFRKFK